MAKIYIKKKELGGKKMDMSNMKNMILLKNLPSNIVEEAIVVLKENAKVKKYQYADNEEKKNVNKGKEKSAKPVNNSEYIIKEAENVISNYISNLETKSPKWKNNMKKLEKKYKQSVKLNFVLGFVAVISLFVSII